MSIRQPQNINIQNYTSAKNDDKMIVFLITTVSVVFSASELNSHGCAETEEKIDIVYTWVNGSDPDFLRGDVKIKHGDLTRD